MKTKLAGLLLAACVLPASAQAIYRCGNEYSQKPCTGARTIDVKDSPATADAQAANVQAARNAKLADEMERQRVAHERRVGGPAMVVTGLKPAAEKPAEAASHAKPPKKDKGRGKKPAGDFTAVAPKKKSG